MSAQSSHDSSSWNLSRRPDGAVIVRMKSKPNNGHTLPDSVFAFRVGDPQYSFWDAAMREREQRAG